MPSMMEKAVPVLASLDILKTSEYWSDRLGFATVHKEAGYAIMQRDAVQIHFWKCDDKAIPALTSCRVGVQEIENLYEELKAKDTVHPRAALRQQPWGMSEFSIIDGDGNCVTFFEQVP